MQFKYIFTAVAATAIALAAIGGTRYIKNKRKEKKVTGSSWLTDADMKEVGEFLKLTEEELRKGMAGKRLNSNVVVIGASANGKTPACYNHSDIRYQPFIDSNGVVHYRSKYIELINTKDIIINPAKGFIERYQEFLTDKAGTLARVY